MRKKIIGIITSMIMMLMAVGTAHGDGNFVTSEIWIRAVINTEDKGPIEAVWVEGGQDQTGAGDQVIWGYFHANPNDVNWGSSQNPDLFVKIWIDHNGRLDINYFHVSVPDIEVYSDFPYDGTPDEHGITTMSRRYIRQFYENGQSNMDESNENGDPPAGHWPASDPTGYSLTDTLKIGATINTEEKGPLDALWQLGGSGTTEGGHEVIWGHFYANPNDVGWGSPNNPDLFVKIWFDAGGRVDVNFFHVSVPDIEVFSDLPCPGGRCFYSRTGTTIMDNRYIRHEYWTGAEKKPPVPKFTITLSQDTLPPDVVLDAFPSYDPDGDILRYEWTSSANQGSTMNGMKQTLTIPEKGTLTFTLTVTDKDGLQDSLTQSAEITWPDDVEFEVSEFVTSSETPGENCQSPPAETDFDEDDPWITAWAHYRYFEAGKSYEIRWHSPDGTLARTDSGTRESGISEGCTSVKVPGTTLRQYAPGSWRAEFWYDGQKHAETRFDFTSDNWGTDFEVTKFVLTSESPGDDCQQPVSQTAFEDDDALNIWAYYRNAQSGSSYEFRWYSPANILVQTSQGTHDADASGGCSWADIAGEKLGEHGAGQWRVEFYYQGEKYKEAAFTLFSEQPASEFEVAEFLFTGQSPESGCQPPESQSEFTDNDTEVFAWIRFRNFEGGNKSYEFRWYSPNDSDTPAQIHTGSYSAQDASGCSWANLSAETLAAYDSGQWRVEFYHEGSLQKTAFFTFTVTQARPFEVTEFLLTAATPGDSCQAPSAATSFSDDHANVFAWVHHLDFEKGKTYAFKWYAPDGTLAQENQGSHDAETRAGCSWFSISSEKLREYGSGQWRVEFHYDGEKYEDSEFYFTSDNPNKVFEVTEFLFTEEYGSDSECQKPESRRVFSDSDDSVTAWVHYYFFESGKSYAFKWYNPEGNLVQQSDSDLHASGLQNGCAWSSMPVSKLQEYQPGQWQVEFYYDDQRYGTEYFTFTSAHSGFEIAEFVTTSESPNTYDCEAPKSETAFGDSVAKVTAWVRYHRFESGKSYAFNWYSPDGSLAQINSSDTGAEAGNGCLWADIPLEKLQAYFSGQWRVEFHYDGQKHGQTLFDFTSQHSDTEFDISKFILTNEYSLGNCQEPESEIATFTDNDTEVIAWVYYRNLGSGKSYEFKWYAPDGHLVETNTGTSGDADVPRGCTWTRLSTEELRKYDPGQWSVEFFYDGQSYGKEYFSFGTSG